MRQKMWERLQELKGAREEERQAEVQKRLDMKFKTSNDDLRKEDAQFYNYGTAIEREKQLIDKRRQHEQRMLEEQVYSQLWALDGQKKLEREVKEQAEKKQKISDTMAVLEWQKQTRDHQRSAEVMAIQREREMLREQWAIEDARDKEAEHQKFLLNRERNLQLIQHNAQEKQIRELADLAEKQRDKQMLEKALAREAALKRLEEEEKEARKREMVELQKHYNQGRIDKAAYEKMIDDLVAEENAKQWDAREQQWRREDQARVNLLKNVYANREQDVLLKQAKKREEDWLKNQDKHFIDNDTTRQNKLFEDKQVTAAVNRKTHQTDILK